jgi:hypothetical protein
MIKFTNSLISLMLFGGLAACQTGSTTHSLDSVKQVKVCSGFGCIYQQTLTFSSDDIEHIGIVMAKGTASPEQERASLSELVAWKERLAQKRLKMRRDTRLSYQRDAGIRGQMDCVDESSNTLAFVRFLEAEGLLRHHKAKRIAERGFLFDGRYPHKTAIVIDSSNKEWAIDSWKKHGGEPPQVVAYSIWKKERASEYR